MKTFTVAASLVIAPVIVQAQTSIQAQSHAQVSASATSGKEATTPQGSAKTQSSTDASARSPHRLGADAQGKVDANLRVARERKLPEEPIRHRVAEGEAKGASDAQIVAASGRTLVDLQSSFDAMGRGGHPAPSDAEVTRGASLLARGYTSAQIQDLAHSAPSDRSLVVAFDAVTALGAHGVPSGRAVAQVESQLAARASDAQLISIASTADLGANVSGVLGGRSTGRTQGSAATTGSAGMAGSTAAGAGAAAGLVGAATAGASGAGTVSGAVAGVLGKP